MVPNIPIWSPVVRSNQPASSSIPRNILPPQTTITISSNSCCTRYTIFFARKARKFGSIPYHCAHCSASPESFRRTRFGVWYFFIKNWGNQNYIRGENRKNTTEKTSTRTKRRAIEMIALFLLEISFSRVSTVWASLSASSVHFVLADSRRNVALL